MHIILLKFGPNRASAADHMEGHNEWIAKGLSDGVFQCVGSLDIGGGFILAHGESDTDIRYRVEKDPFVQQNVVTAEVHAVDVKRTAPQLDYLTSGL